MLTAIKLTYHSQKHNHIRHSLTYLALALLNWTTGWCVSVTHETAERKFWVYRTWCICMWL